MSTTKQAKDNFTRQHKGIETHFVNFGTLPPHLQLGLEGLYSLIYCAPEAVLVFSSWLMRLGASQNPHTQAHTEDSEQN